MDKFDEIIGLFEEAVKRTDELGVPLRGPLPQDKRDPNNPLRAAANRSYNDLFVGIMRLFPKVPTPASTNGMLQGTLGPVPNDFRAILQFYDGYNLVPIALLRKLLQTYRAPIDERQVPILTQYVGRYQSALGEEPIWVNVWLSRTVA